MTATTAGAVLAKRLYSLSEAATYLGVTERQVSRLRAQGDLPVRYLGTKPLYDVNDLNRYIDSLPSEKKKAS